MLCRVPIVIYRTRSTYSFISQLHSPHVLQPLTLFDNTPVAIVVYGNVFGVVQTGSTGLRLQEYWNPCRYVRDLMLCYDTWHVLFLKRLLLRCAVVRSSENRVLIRTRDDPSGTQIQIAIIWLGYTVVRNRIEQYSKPKMCEERPVRECWALLNPETLQHSKCLALDSSLFLALTSRVHTVARKWLVVRFPLNFTSTSGNGKLSFFVSVSNTV